MRFSPAFIVSCLIVYRELVQLKRDYKRKESMIKTLQADAKRKEIIIKKRSEEVWLRTIILYNIQYCTL